MPQLKPKPGHVIVAIFKKDGGEYYQKLESEHTDETRFDLAEHFDCWKEIPQEEYDAIFNTSDAADFFAQGGDQ